MIKPDRIDNKPRRLLKKLRLGGWRDFAFDIRARAILPLQPDQIDAIMDRLIEKAEAAELALTMCITPSGLYAGVTSAHKYSCVGSGDIRRIFNAVSDVNMFTDIETTHIYDPWWETSDDLFAQQ